MIKFNRLRWVGLVARMKDGRSAFKILTSTPTGNISSGRPRRRWEDNIITDLKEIDINRGIWVNSDQDRDYSIALMNAVLSLRVP